MSGDEIHAELVADMGSEEAVANACARIKTAVDTMIENRRNGAKP